MANKDVYKESICLPKTTFPMRANLPVREPEMVAFWQERGIYEKALEHNAQGPRFVFHDGPPYANGTIHHGHILNKVLKDIVVKYRLMTGHQVRYIPGWDCHGLPIELAAEREMGKASATADKLSIRKRCEEFALTWSSTQLEELRRLGIFSDWDHPYRTIDPAYEQTICEQLATMVDKGMVYRGEKPVYWCADCTTALAEAEVEYYDHRSPSIYVRYAAKDADALRTVLDLHDDKPISIVIWTTTPWTLPASLVIAVHPAYLYRAYDVGGEYVVIAQDMAESVFAACGLQAAEAGTAVPGARLERMVCRHPFLDRDIPVLLADYVTLDAGTGCVHTAPGHGQEDYVLCAAHGIAPYAPVDADGRFTQDVPQWQGRKVAEANADIVQFLADTGVLLNPVGQHIDHQYPCCWRCKNPVIFRATPQWFISMDKTGLRQVALEQIDATRWIPPWGRDRIRGMIEDRPDWCISRQRLWGVPLPFFTCVQCGEPLVRGDVIRHVAAIFGKEGSDAWFRRGVEELLPEGTTCACGGTRFEKEENIIDVWFESGVSWAAVAKKHPDLGYPVDLYLEGSDQHRGWFHTSLLTSCATEGRAPYKAVLTHGFICNEEGKKYSKSQKNFVPPQRTIDTQGAEILRMWVAYEDYRSDIVYAPTIIASLSDSYRKIRNTVRFLLGNTSDFDPTVDAVPVAQMPELDRWMLDRFGRYLERVGRAYEEYDFHHIFHRTIALVTNELSSFYLDIVKDRLYCEARTGRLRRSAQTVLFLLARDLLRVLAPVLSFTAEEAWQHLLWRDKPESVFLAGFPCADPAWRDDALAQRWETVRTVRKEVTRVLEDMRRAGRIGNSLDAAVTVHADPATIAVLEELGAEVFGDICLVSELALVTGDALRVEARECTAPKCPRCWRKGHQVGADGRYPELCGRCAAVFAARQESGA